MCISGVDEGIVPFLVFFAFAMVFGVDGAPTTRVFVDLTK